MFSSVQTMPERPRLSAKFNRIRNKHVWHGLLPRPRELTSAARPSRSGVERGGLISNLGFESQSQLLSRYE